MSYLTKEEEKIVIECRKHDLCSDYCPTNLMDCGRFYDMHKLNPDSDKVKTCPVCGRMYTDRPAVSRRPGLGEICPECGQKEALEDWNKAKAEGRA